MLIQFLGRDHDGVLYIGHDKAVIDHINRIDICHTYYVKTDGLTHRDLDQLQQRFFNDVHK